MSTSRSARTSALDAEVHKLAPAIRVLGDHKPIDLLAQRQVRAVIAHQINLIGGEIVVNHVLGAGQPVAQNFKKTALPQFGRHVQILWKRQHRLFVCLKKQAVFTFEMLKDGALCDAELRRNVLDASGAVAAIRKMTNRHFHNARPFGLRARTRLRVTPQLYRFRQPTCNSLQNFPPGFGPTAGPDLRSI